MKQARKTAYSADMRYTLNRINSLAQFIIGIVFMLLMFRVGFEAFLAAFLLTCLAYPVYRLLGSLPLGSTILYLAMAWVAHAAGQDLLISMGMFYVPFSLVVDVVNIYGLYAPYRAYHHPLR